MVRFPEPKIAFRKRLAAVLVTFLVAALACNSVSTILPTPDPAVTLTKTATAPTTKTLTPTPTLTPTVTLTPTATQPPPPEDAILLSISMPLGEKSCGDFNLHLDTYHDDLVRNTRPSGFRIYYTAEYSLGELPDNVMMYDVEEGSYIKTCFSAEQSTVGGTYYIPYSVKIFKEESENPDPATREFLTEGNVFIRLRVLPAVYPDEKMIAFISGRSEEQFHYVYVMSLDGTRLTMAPIVWSESDPRWSSDGSRLYALIQNDSIEGVYPFSNVNLAFEPVFGDYSALSFDKKLRASVDWMGDEFVLSLIDADGKTEHKIISNVSIDSSLSYNVFLSPDGKKVIYTKDNNLYLFDIDSSESVQLTADAAFRSGIAWSPDSRKIAYTSLEGTELYTISIEDQTILKLVTGGQSVSHITWSPDSDQIAYGSSFALFVANADGSSILKLIDEEEGASPPFSWSPDSSQILFGPFHVKVVNRDGSGYRQLTEDIFGYSYSDPVWSPDGQYILLIVNNKNAQNIYRMKSDGSELINLTLNDLSLSGNYDPAWQP